MMKNLTTDMRIKLKSKMLNRLLASSEILQHILSAGSYNKLDNILGADLDLQLEDCLFTEMDSQVNLRRRK